MNKPVDITFAQPDYEKLTLPSNGIGVQKLKHLMVRPMTMKEEKLLTNKTLQKEGRVHDEIFKACVRCGIDTEGKEVAIDWDNLLTEDEYALLLFVRAISYGRDYEVTVECPTCEKTQDIVIDIEKDLPVVMAADGYPTTFQVDLPASKKKVTMRLPRRKDSKDSLHETLMRLIESVEGLDKNTITMWANSIITRDIAEMRHAATKYSNFGAANKINYVCQNDKCAKCGVAQEVALPITSEFFRL
jgi:hypothetical protein